MKTFCNAQIFVAPDGKFIVILPSYCRQFIFDNCIQLSEFLKKRLKPNKPVSQCFRRPRSFYVVEKYVSTNINDILNDLPF